MTAPATVTPISAAKANRAYVRRLLRERQPAFAAALEAAVTDLNSDPGLPAEWLHALYRAEVEDARCRLDEAAAPRSRLLEAGEVRRRPQAIEEAVALLRGQAGGE